MSLSFGAPLPPPGDYEVFACVDASCEGAVGAVAVANFKVSAGLSAASVSFNVSVEQDGASESVALLARRCIGGRLHTAEAGASRTAVSLS